MTHPLHHAQSSVNRWGGQVSDYIGIHNWFDSTKSTFCDYRHRALRHHSFGIFEAEQKFGLFVTNSDGVQVPVRYVGELHVKQDCAGIVPSVGDWLSRIPRESWMSRGYRDTAE